MPKYTHNVLYVSYCKYTKNKEKEPFYILLLVTLQTIIDKLLTIIKELRGNSILFNTLQDRYDKSIIL